MCAVGWETVTEWLVKRAGGFFDLLGGSHRPPGYDWRPTRSHRLASLPSPPWSGVIQLSKAAQWQQAISSYKRYYNSKMVA